jgi:hypothetical protein
MLPGHHVCLAQAVALAKTAAQLRLRIREFMAQARCSASLSRARARAHSHSHARTQRPCTDAVLQNSAFLCALNLEAHPALVQQLPAQFAERRPPTLARS